MDYPEDVLDHTGESMFDVDEDGEYPAPEITERPSLSSSLDAQERADTLRAQSTDLTMSRETELC